MKLPERYERAGSRSLGLSWECLIRFEASRLLLPVIVCCANIAFFGNFSCSGLAPNLKIYHHMDCQKMRKIEVYFNLFWLTMLIRSTSIPGILGFDHIYTVS